MTPLVLSVTITLEIISLSNDISSFSNIFEFFHRVYITLIPFNLIYIKYTLFNESFFLLLLLLTCTYRVMILSKIHKFILLEFYYMQPDNISFFPQYFPRESCIGSSPIF